MTILIILLLIIIILQEHQYRIDKRIVYKKGYLQGIKDEYKRLNQAGIAKYSKEYEHQLKFYYYI